MDKVERKRSQETENKALQKTLIKFVSVVIVLVTAGAYIQFNKTPSDDSPAKFFAERKAPNNYHNYKEDSDDAKTKAQRGIYLQD